MCEWRPDRVYRLEGTTSNEAIMVEIFVWEPHEGYFSAQANIRYSRPDEDIDGFYIFPERDLYDTREEAKEACTARVIQYLGLDNDTLNAN